MGWKEWPSWLKGGVIGIAVGALFSIYSFFNGCYVNYGGAYTGIGCFGFGSVVSMFIAGLGFFLMKPWASIPPFSIFRFLGIIINLFIVGILLGWIVGKIKQKKEITP